MSIREKTPIYDGATPRSAQVNLQQPQQLEPIQHQGELIDRTINHVERGFEQLAKIDDFRSKQELRRSLRENDAALQEAIREKMENGELYGQDGRVNDVELKSLIDKHKSNLGTIPRNFWLRENAIEGEQMVADSSVDLGLTATRMVFQEQTSRVRQALNDQINYYKSVGDNDAVDRTLQEAGDAGVLSPFAVATAQNENNQNRILKMATDTYNTNQGQFLKDYYNGNYKDATGKTLDAINSMLDSIDFGASENTKKLKKNADGTVTVQSADAPGGLPPSMVNMWRKHQGDFKNNPDALKDATPVCIAWARNHITSVDDAEEEARVKSVFKCFGLDDSTANDVIKSRRNELSGVDYNPGKLLDGVGAKYIMPAATLKAYNQDKETLKSLNQMNDRELYKDSGQRTPGGAILKNNELKRNLETKIAQQDAYVKYETAKAKASVDARYQIWKNENPEATPEEQCNKYANLSVEYFNQFKPAEDLSNWQAMKEQQEMAGSYTQYTKSKRIEAKRARDAQDAASDEADKERANEAAKPAADRPTTVNLSPYGKDSIDKPETDDESIIYVPESSGLNHGSVVTIRHGDSVTQAKIVHYPEADEAIFSMRLKKDLHMLRDGGLLCISVNGNNLTIEPQTSSLTPDDSPDDGLLSVREYEVTNEEAEPMSDAIAEGVLGTDGRVHAVVRKKPDAVKSAEFNRRKKQVE